MVNLHFFCIYNSGHPQEESSFDRYHSLLVTSRIVPYQVIPHGSLCKYMYLNGLIC